MLIAGSAVPAFSEWKNDRFLVGGWLVGNTSEPRRMAAIRDAGIDVVVNGDRFDVIEVERTIAWLDSVAAVKPGASMQTLIAYRNSGGADDAIAFQRNPRSRAPAMRQKLTGHRSFLSPRVLGWMVWDEPSTEQDFTDIGETIDVLSGQTHGRNLLPYVNLYPLHVTNQSTFRSLWPGDPVASYDRYLDRYFRVFSDRGRTAPLVCFDIYPFETGKCLDDVFLNLDRVRLAARRASPAHPVPMWVMVQLSPSRAPDGHYWPTPDMARMRWQVSAALAYGAKGIQYYTLAPSGPGGFGAGLIDVQGHRTARFDSLRIWHQQLHRLGNAMLGLDAVSVTHAAALGQRGIEDALVASDAREDRFVTGIAGGGDAGMVGHLRARTNGRDHLLVVNKSLTAPATLTITLAKAAARIERFSATSGKWTTIARSSRSFVLKGVRAGDAVLCRVIPGV